MTMTMRIVLAAFAICLAFGANAEPSDRWFEVDNGSWAPSTETIADIRQQIESFVSMQTRAEGLTLRDWGSYTFQYQGQKENGRKFVFINAFCVNDKTAQLKKRMLQVTDGGTCFFNLKFDPQKKRFFDLRVHREA